ncbi:unnamed protein product [Mortierella alpina]
MTSQSPTGTANTDKVSFSPEDQLPIHCSFMARTSRRPRAMSRVLKPAFFDVAARSKWQAWANMRGMSQQEAQEIYVDLVVKS